MTMGYFDMNSSVAQYTQLNNAGYQGALGFDVDLSPQDVTNLLKENPAVARAMLWNLSTVGAPGTPQEDIEAMNTQLSKLGS